MYGKGYAYYVGCYTEKEELKEIYRRALEHAGITVNLEICFPVIIRSGVNQSGRTLHYLLHYSEEESVISCPYKRVRNVLSGKEFRMGDQITIPKWDVMILEEEEDA